MPLKKLTLTAFRDPKYQDQIGQPVSVAINPEEYSHSAGIEYARTDAQGAPASSQTFDRMAQERVSFTLWFDGTGVVPDAGPLRTTSITPLISAFKKAVIFYNGQVHQPSFVKLTWGTFLFKCRLEKLDITYTLFNPDGVPIRAKCAVSFLSDTSPKAAATAAKTSSPDLAHLVTVRAGDTLPLLCHRVYGSSVHYTKVARFNGLGSFRALRPGMQLLFPRLDQSGP